MELYWLIRGIFRLKRTDLGLAFLVSLASWFILVPMWAHSKPGDLVYRAVGGLLSPAYGAGHRLGEVVFPDYRTPHSTGFYWVPLFGAAGELLLLMLLWYLGIRLVRWMRAEQQDRQTQNF